jgi:hypothetical protein
MPTNADLTAPSGSACQVGHAVQSRGTGSTLFQMAPQTLVAHLTTTAGGQALPACTHRRGVLGTGSCCSHVP